MSPPTFEPFPWYLVLLLELLHVSICYPTSNTYVRQWVLAPAMVAISVHLYTKRAHFEGPGSLAHAIGSNMASNLCSMTYLVYVQKGFPDFWRRTKDERSGDEMVLPSKFPFKKKIMWASDLYFDVRRVGWVQGKNEVLPPRPNCSRMAFIRSKMFYGLLHLLMIDLVFTYQAGNPAFDIRVHQDTDGPETYLRGKALLWRIPDILSWQLGIVCGLSLVHTALAVVSVGLGLSEPADWPPMFGSFQDAYSIRRLWGKVWHQRMRSMVSGIGKFVAHNVCRLTPRSNLSSFTQLCVAFGLSGLIHAGGDYMVLGGFPSFPLQFFLLQAVAIPFEDFVILIAKPIWSRMDHKVNRTIGYLWVILWFCWAAPIWLDPLSVGGAHVNNRGVIFGRLLDLWNGRL